MQPGNCCSAALEPVKRVDSAKVWQVFGQEQLLNRFDENPKIHQAKPDRIQVKQSKKMFSFTG